MASKTFFWATGPHLRMVDYISLYVPDLIHIDHMHLDHRILSTGVCVSHTVTAPTSQGAISSCRNVKGENTPQIL